MLESAVGVGRATVEPETSQPVAPDRPGATGIRELAQIFNQDDLR